MIVSSIDSSNAPYEIFETWSETTTFAGRKLFW